MKSSFRKFKANWTLSASDLTKSAPIENVQVKSIMELLVIVKGVWYLGSDSEQQFWLPRTSEK